MTPGFVSSTARSFRGPRGRRIAGAIEHTAPLPRGSSGGPLVDARGSAARDQLGPRRRRPDPGDPRRRALRERVEALGRGEAPERVRLGVAIAPPRVARRLAAPSVCPSATASWSVRSRRAAPPSGPGIERGDLIVAAGGREIERVDALYEALDGARGRRTLELTIVRGTDERTVTVTF